MKVTIFGGTGHVGRCLVEQSLEQGHDVTALVRSPGKLAVQHSRLKIVVGDVLDPNKVLEAVEGANGILCALGSGLTNPGTVLSQGTQNIVSAMKHGGVKRVVVISAFGIGDSRSQLPFSARLLGNLLRRYRSEKESQEAAVRESGLDWIVVRPWRLVVGAKTPNYEVGLKPKSLSPISYADLADFMIRQLTSNGWLQQTPAIVGS